MYRSFNNNIFLHLCKTIVLFNKDFSSTNQYIPNKKISNQCFIIKLVEAYIKYKKIF